MRQMQRTRAAPDPPTVFPQTGATTSSAFFGQCRRLVFTDHANPLGLNNRACLEYVPLHFKTIAAPLPISVCHPLAKNRG